MILFCEECGMRNHLEQAKTVLLKDGFVCLHCGFRTPLDALSDSLCADEGRAVPESSSTPEGINLGNISCEKRLTKLLTMGNGGVELLKLQIIPDPRDYSIAARFIFDSALAMSVAPGEKKQIPYSLWPIKDISVDWGFSQRIQVLSNKSGQKAVRNIVIYGKVIAPTGK